MAQLLGAKCNKKRNCISSSKTQIVEMFSHQSRRQGVRAARVVLGQFRNHPEPQPEDDVLSIFGLASQFASGLLLLKQHNIAHVFNAWSKMPELATQMSLKDSFTADFTVVRALLRHGRVYDDAVDKFAPYEIIQDENPPARQALQSLIERAKAKKEPSFIFVNNRLEGNAPKTIEAVVSDE